MECVEAVAADENGPENPAIAGEADVTCEEVIESNEAEEKGGEGLAVVDCSTERRVPSTNDEATSKESRAEGAGEEVDER